MQLLPKTALVAALLAATAAAPLAGAQTAGSTYADVWAKTQAGPYAVLPQHQSLYATFFDGATNLLAAAANRTLWTNDDTLPRFQKLVHPIGICFAGTWSITEANPYTGYFANGSNGLIIVRASEAMGHPTAADWRAFGFAGKIFPTTDPTDQTPHQTANFFTVDDLGGTDASSFLDLPKSNEPKTSLHLSDLAIFPTLTEIAKVFATADSNPGVRQVYDISELGLPDPTTAVTPRWFSVRAENEQRVATADFRDELRLANYPGGLTFGIYVANVQDQWTRIGQIQLTEEALADGCDHTLHFHHPPSK